MTLSEIASLLTLPVDGDIPTTGFSIDSRTLKQGNVFVALNGACFDGHDYILEAALKGASCILCERPDKNVNIPQLVVQDTLEALGTLAISKRNTFKGTVIALTGSNGKTTVKEMIASILPKPSLATSGNLNNHIGVPLTLLQLKPEYLYAVLELGANHLGEIAHTVAMVKPDIALVNNIAPAHVEGFGSIEGVAKAKGEIYEGLSAKGIAIINEDDAYSHFWDATTQKLSLFRFSAIKPADIYAKDIQTDASGCCHFNLITPIGKQEIHLKVPGKHQVSNALAAASCCFAAGISLENIQQGLENFTGVQGRMMRLSGIKQSLIIDDTYNANLRSVLAALEVLAGYKGKRIFILGDMGELGAWAVQHHQEVGEAAKRLGIDCMITCGKYSQSASETFGNKSRHYSNQEGLADFLKEKLDADTTVLVKGSRSSGMEKIVQQLMRGS